MNSGVSGLRSVGTQENDGSEPGLKVDPATFG